MFKTIFLKKEMYANIILLQQIIKYRGIYIVNFFTTILLFTTIFCY